VSECLSYTWWEWYKDSQRDKRRLKGRRRAAEAVMTGARWRREERWSGFMEWGGG
jgi:hypothetical protein